jgi:hypothetical protein
MRHVWLGLGVMLAAALAGCDGGASSPTRHARSIGKLFLEGPAKHGNLIAVDTHTGRIRRLPIKAACGDAQNCLVPSGGKLVIGSVGRTYVYDPRRPGRPRAQRIGNGWIIVPSATDGRVWLAILDRSRGVLRAIREQTVDGRVTQSGRPPGAGESWPVGAVEPGLLFQTVRGHRAYLRLWDPKTRKVTLRTPGLFPIDTHDDLVASCDEPCSRLAITDVRSGKTTRVKPPAGHAFRASDDGAFSPDGSLLALPVASVARARNPGHGRWSMARSMALVNVGRGTPRIIRGSRLDPDYRTMSWSASDGRLFFSAGGGRVMAYRPGSPRATSLARVHGTIFHMAAL